MLVSKIIATRQERVGFFSWLEYSHEIDVSSFDAREILDVYYREFLKAYIHATSNCRTPKQLINRRDNLGFRGLSAYINAESMKWRVEIQ